MRDFPWNLLSGGLGTPAILAQKPGRALRSSSGSEKRPGISSAPRAEPVTSSSPWKTPKELEKNGEFRGERRENSRLSMKL